MAENWSVGSCSPGHNSLVAVHGGYGHFYAYVKVVFFTPCALNGLPHHGVQEQSQEFVCAKGTKIKTHKIKVMES